MKDFKIRLYNKIPEELEEIVNNLKKQAYQKNMGALTETQKNEREDKFCSQKDRFKYLLMFQNREIIGGLTLLKRKIVYNDEKIILGGVGGVWTRVDKRKMGVASLLLRKGIEFLLQNKCDIAFLCTNIKKLGKLYERFGFTPLNREYTFIGRSGKRYYEADGMIANVSSDKIFKKVLKGKIPLDIGRGVW